MPLRVDFIDNSSEQYAQNACEIRLRGIDGKGKGGRLYLGDISSASFLQLKHRKVSSVVTCDKELFGYCKEADILYCKVDPDDKLAGFEEATKFVHEELGKGRNVLVHCSKGEGKSAAVIIYYMMKMHKQSAGKTVAELRKIWSGVKPRVTSTEYLIAVEKRLLGSATIALGGKGNREVVLTDSSEWSLGESGSDKKKSNNGPPLGACLILLGLLGALFGALYIATGGKL